jgi:DNA-binding PadR family transcriptional regulator
MYPILMRLADRGLLEADWESDPMPGRPPRHLYRLTGAGLTYAATVVVDVAPPAIALRTFEGRFIPSGGCR